jgi:prepilin-type N-terminal cleavage/methylation domain-containing protein
MTTPVRQEGFSLIESLVALAILAIVMGSLIPGFVYYSRTNTGMETRMEAVAAAQQVLDERRTVNPASMPSSGSTTRNVTIGNRTFTTRIRYCLQSSYCGANTRHITVEVEYNGSQVYRTQTVYTQLK